MTATGRPRFNTGSNALSIMLMAAILPCFVGCKQEGLRVLVPPLASLRQVPVAVVMEDGQLEKSDFLFDAEGNQYRPMPQNPQPAWIAQQRTDALCRDYFSQSQLFRLVLPERPHNGLDGYLVCRPRVAVRQYVRPSVGGTMLTLGTGLIYNILGGSAVYRYVDCQIGMDVESPTGRPIASYLAACRSAERLATDGPDQLGPLASYAFTKSLEDVAQQISLDNDLLMRALAADLSAKGVAPVVAGGRIAVRHPRSVIVRGGTAQISGQVLGVDVPAVMEWSVNGSPGGAVPLVETSAASVQEFAIAASLPEGVARVSLAVRAKGQAKSAAAATPAAELARTEIAYLCHAADAKDKAALPEVRRRWAVVIGISNYARAGGTMPNLRYASRDAEGFRDFLCSTRSGGFEPNRVMCLLDEQATVANVRHALFEFLAQSEKDDLVVIFFSGHGMPQAGSENFFMLCHDTDASRLASTAFPMWDIDTALRRFVKADRVVVLADACHSGGMSPPAGAKGADANPVHQYLQQLAIAQPGRLVFTASEARELSFESDKYGGGHGVFTHYLLEALNGAANADRDGVISAGEVIDYVQTNVKSATDGKQHPNPSGQFDRKLPLAVVNPR